MNRRLHLGIVGCGDIAEYAAFFAQLNPGIHMTACCDIDGSRAERFARRHRIPLAFSDYSRMLTVSELDAVYLAVPHFLHFGMLRQAVEAGLPALVEKPITCTLEEGREIVSFSASRGVKIGVNYQYRYDKGCYALARAVQSGLLGKVHYGRTNVPWQRQQDYFEKSPWHARKDQAGGGTLLTQGSHLLDILLWAAGSKPLSAIGFTAQMKFKQVEVEDLAQGILQLENGALLQISSSMVAAPEQPVTLEVYGERGTAIYCNRPRPHVRFLGVKVRKELPPAKGVHALQKSLEGFRAWIVEDKPFLIPAKTALPVLAAIEAIYRSAETGNSEHIMLED